MDSRGLFSWKTRAALVDELFDKLSDKDSFVRFVSEYFETAPAEIGAVMRCVPKLDRGRVELAFGEYHQNIERFAVLLHSSNPDHYKRAGALLHALYQAEPIVDIELESTTEELEAGYTRVTLGDAEHVLKFVEFYEQYHNHMLAFDLAYRCCAAYEAEPKVYDFDYLHNMCRYLASNKNLSVDSFFIIFKSLMM